MHSLSASVFNDFNATTGPRRQWLDRGDYAKTRKIIACKSERDSGGSVSSSVQNQGQSLSEFVSRSQSYTLLKQQMEFAVKSEDYKEAARLRDSLRALEQEEPILRLRGLMKEAVADERFEDAASYLDKLKDITPDCLLKCSSDATTLGIRVQVSSTYDAALGQPSKGEYYFVYKMRITNKSDRPVQLFRRHWIITDGNGRTENLWGIGVNGQQPVIHPNTEFKYSSVCPLNTPSGRMEGDFEMQHIDRVGSKVFNVAIAPFSLFILGDGGDSLSD
ncbi:hypothetical protein NMG60_11004449 [Bertholletia excelsa]